MSQSYEVNFDGLIGPTHHFAGLSFGNIASTLHQGRTSNPKKAALQGLRKMKMLYDAGLKQGVLPPLCKPDLGVLKNLGFSGTLEAILFELSSQSPEMISAFFSASSMWAANSATVSASTDTHDGKVHITPANLTSKFHRALESSGTQRVLRTIFASENHFKIHDPLFPHPNLGDEGAANTTRFCQNYERPGLQFFVYGRSAFQKDQHAPKKYPARQTLEASQAVARSHGLKPEHLVFAQQNPIAIDAGAFHNDVVSVGNKNILFFHQDAFLNESFVLEELKTKFDALNSESLQFIRVQSNEVPLNEIVKSYLFNSQILSLPSGETLLLAPSECQESDVVRNYLESMIGQKNAPIQRVEYVNLRESMQNGGGPACLRLRVPLNENELCAVHPGVLLNAPLIQQLEVWVEKNYRDHLQTSDLCDPKFNIEVETALDELTQILKLGAIYSFQI
jgi:succinylarginine dihydrolase